MQESCGLRLTSDFGMLSLLALLYRSFIWMFAHIVPQLADRCHAAHCDLDGLSDIDVGVVFQ